MGSKGGLGPNVIPWPVRRACSTVASLIHDVRHTQAYATFTSAYRKFRFLCSALALPERRSTRTGMFRSRRERWLGFGRLSSLSTTASVAPALPPMFRLAVEGFLKRGRRTS